MQLPGSWSNGLLQAQLTSAHPLLVRFSQV
jgi:hypothetical protein